MRLGLAMPDFLAAIYTPALKRPDMEIVFPAQPGANIDYLLTVAPPAGLIPSLTGLKCVMAIGAGVEHVLDAGPFPARIPLARLPQDDLKQRMMEYVVLHVLRAHRDVLAYESQQRNRVWQMLWPQKAAPDRIVGVAGLGEIGSAAACALRGLGFRVRGWSRTLKPIDHIDAYAGPDGLASFLDGVEILVNVLPLTAATRGLVDATWLAALAPGAHLINAGRGATLNEDALLDALDSGRLGSATLDVFAVEPLPADHLFWSHPRITITPHCASAAEPHAVAAAVFDTIARVERGEPPRFIVDLDRGY